MERAVNNNILELLDVAEYSNKRADYQKALDYINSIEEKYPNDPMYHYYRGYAALSMPDGKSFYRKMAIKSFNHALELDSNNKNALFHLSDCYYELGQYKVALEGYARVLEMLKGEKNQVVGLSILERILSCFLKLNQHSKFLDNYNQWIRSYRSTQEIEMMTIPRELIRSVSEYLKNKGDRINPELKKQFKNVSVDLLSILNQFPKAKRNYKDQIETLQNWDGQYSEPYLYELV